MKPARIWGLDTGRTGEFMQILALAEALDLPFERIRLPVCEDALPAAPPCLILSFGRAARTAVGLVARIRNNAERQPLLVQLGTPGHLPSSAFDLIIPQPQDDYPPGRHVQFLQLPLNGATQPRPESAPENGSCVVVIGGPTRHFRMPISGIRRLLRFSEALAKANREPLEVITSPRTPSEVTAELHRQAAARGFRLHADGAVPLSRLLAAGSRFVVTSDSASMLAEACRTGAPVWLFRQPNRPNLDDILQRAADSCSLGRQIRHRLVRKGWLGGGTDFARWHHVLQMAGLIRMACWRSEDELRWSSPSPAPDDDLQVCRNRIMAMLRESGAMPSR
jgi:mitochondrial fission protein ELM1